MVESSGQKKKKDALKETELIL